MTALSALANHVSAKFKRIRAYGEADKATVFELVLAINSFHRTQKMRSLVIGVSFQLLMQRI
jgi:hypothetical protein